MVNKLLFDREFGQKAKARSAERNGFYDRNGICLQSCFYADSPGKELFFE